MHPALKPHCSAILQTVPKEHDADFFEAAKLLPSVVVVHVMSPLFPYTANIYAHVMESADRKNADILADVFLKKA